MSEVTLLLVLLVTATAIDASKVMHAPPGSDKTGCYMVKLKDDISHNEFQKLEERLLEESSDHHIFAKVEGSVSKIITAKLSEEAVERVSLGLE